MTVDHSTRAKLQEEYKLLAERARASKAEADQIRTALKEKQAYLNQAESDLTTAQNNLVQYETQLKALTTKINQSKEQVQKSQEALNATHQETAMLAQSLGPVAQKQKRFTDALALVVQNLESLSVSKQPAQPPAQPPAQAAPLAPPILKVEPAKQPQTPKSDSGRNVRADMELNLSFEIDLGKDSEHNFYTGLTNNISEGGVFISTTQVLDLGTKIKFPLALPGMMEAEPVEGEVRWVRREGRAEENVPSGIGVQFTKISKNLQMRINQYIRKRDSIFYDD